MTMVTRHDRLIEWFESEETFKCLVNHLVQPQYHGQGHFSLDQVTQRSISDLPSLHSAAITCNSVTVWHPFPCVRDGSEK